jgi:SAM-dependent methyltransferase
MMTDQLLNRSHPELAAEWHPTKNGILLPDSVTGKSSKRVWWKCTRGPDHEWDARICDRARTNTKCPFCINQKVALSNSLLTKFPEIAIEWHPIKNQMKALQIAPGSSMKAWWVCKKDSSHEWQATPNDRTGPKKSLCPFCANRATSNTNNLEVLYPKISKEWHPTKNAALTPKDVVAGSKQRVWWKCSSANDHEWKATIYDRTQNDRSCPFCANKKVCSSNSLELSHPDIAAQWHPTKNGTLLPKDVVPGSCKHVWWKCPDGTDHEWKTSVKAKIKNKPCPFCSRKKACQSNALSLTHPLIALEWNTKRNGTLTPDNILFGSAKKVWWQCRKNPSHEWQATPNDRTGDRTGCPCCSGKKVSGDNSLHHQYPHLTQEWDFDKNYPLTPKNVVPGSNKNVWWKCSIDPSHIWQSTVYNRAILERKCPDCQPKWTIERIRRFVSSLIPHIDSLTPAGLYVVFQQNGLFSMAAASKGHSFVQALKTGCFPKEELEKFVQGEPSLVDEFISDPEKTLDSSEVVNILAPENILSEHQINVLEGSLPIVETKDVLAVLESTLFTTQDREAMDFFIKEAVARIWQHAFSDEKAALRQVDEYKDEGLYAQEVKRLFLEDYLGTKALLIPDGYSFSHQPNLMQLYTAYLVKSRKRLGNWSGTGAGKTLSAILASRVIEAHLTVICCPNNVIDNWKRNIRGIYPDSLVFSKKIDIKDLNASKKPTYLILNYEFFQQPRAESKLKTLLAECTVNFVIIDEIHYSKQREAERVSDRKRVVASFLSEAAVRNPDLHVLGMSATPVINNLFEGKTLIELVTGVHHDDLQTKPTLSNCVSHYQKFVSHGIRWLPRYSYKLNLITEEIDCSSLVSEIRQRAAFGSMVDVEAVITKAKIPFILEKIRPKTVVYTHYLKDILIPLQDAIERAGWKVAIFTGENKSGLDEFVDADADVLIASSCVGTGIDRLQHVSNRLIISSLPWTHAEFEQLIGRFYRQGQLRDFVDVFVPLTFATINGEKWAWCESRWKRIQFKKSISDAAVDGVIPEGHLRTPGQAYKDAMLWLERLDRGELYEIERRPISIALSEEITPLAHRRFGDLSQMNYRINHDTSFQTHERFLKNPEEWEHYHAIYREDRQNWPVVPYQEALNWFKARPHMVVGDFGCGEAFLAAELENKVFSFDHIAINENVTACDMTHVPLDDLSLDAAVFSLSLMGSNFLDYLKEAHRCLKLDGHLWIAEPTSRIKEIHSFKELLFRLGFDVLRIDEKWKFTFIKAIKSERDINLQSLGDIRSQVVLN